MIIVFYEASLQLAMSHEEAHIIYSPAELESPDNYLRITGTWKEGLLIYRSDLEEYNTRHLPGVYYKLNKTNQTKSIYGYANIGWGILGPLKRSDYPIPSRLGFVVEPGTVNGVMVIKVSPLSQAYPVESQRRRPSDVQPRHNPFNNPTFSNPVQQLRSSPQHPRTVQPIVPQHRHALQTINRVREAEGFQPSLSGSPAARPSLLSRRAEIASTILGQRQQPEQVRQIAPTPVTAQPQQFRAPEPVRPEVAQQPPAQTEPPVQTVVTPSPEVIAELKELAIELNRVLTSNPTLYATVIDGKLRLEEESIQFEEF